MKLTRDELTELIDALARLPSTYFGQLSPASVHSLERQGGPMSPAEVEAFGSHPRAEAAVALRRWDEAAKKPADDGLPMAALSQASSVTSTGPKRNVLTSSSARLRLSRRLSRPTCSFWW